MSTLNAATRTLLLSLSGLLIVCSRYVLVTTKDNLITLTIVQTGPYSLLVPMSRMPREEKGLRVERRKGFRGIIGWKSGYGTICLGHNTREHLGRDTLSCSTRKAFFISAYEHMMDREHFRKKVLIPTGILYSNTRLYRYVYKFGFKGTVGSP